MWSEVAFPEEATERLRYDLIGKFQLETPQKKGLTMIVIHD